MKKFYMGIVILSTIGICSGLFVAFIFLQPYTGHIPGYLGLVYVMLNVGLLFLQNWVRRIILIVALLFTAMFIISFPSAGQSAIGMAFMFPLILYNIVAVIYLLNNNVKKLFTTRNHSVAVRSRMVFLAICSVFILVLYLSSDYSFLARKILIHDDNSSLSSCLGYVVFSMRGDIYSVNLDGTNLKRLTTNRLEEIDPKYSYDGKMICFVRKNNHDGIFLMNADGNNQGQIFEAKNGYHITHPSFSSNGKKVIFNQYGSSGVSKLWEINVDGTGLKDFDLYIYNPHYSTDGQYVYGSDMGKIWKVNISTLEKTVVGSLPSESYEVTYSPDCKKISFISSPYNYQVYIANIDGSNIKKLTYDGGSKHQPAFTQDGSQIVFIHSQDIKIMTADGDDIRKIIAQ